MKEYNTIKLFIAYLKCRNLYQFYKSYVTNKNTAIYNNIKHIKENNIELKSIIVETIIYRRTKEGYNFWMNESQLWTRITKHFNISRNYVLSNIDNYRFQQMINLFKTLPKNNLNLYILDEILKGW